MPRVITDQYQGDPFKTLFEFGGKHYVLDEAALIEQEEAVYREFEADLRRRLADGI